MSVPKEERRSSYASQPRGTARERANQESLRQTSLRQEKKEKPRGTPLFAKPRKALDGDRLTDKLNSAFGEFNEAFNTMCQQKAYTLIGAEALPQTPVDVPLSNSFDFKSDVPRKAEEQLGIKQKGSGVNGNGVDLQDSTNKDITETENTKGTTKGRQLKINLPPRDLVTACTEKNKVPDHSDSEKNRKPSKMFMMLSKMNAPPLTAIQTPVKPGHAIQHFDFTSGEGEAATAEKANNSLDVPPAAPSMASQQLLSDLSDDESSEDETDQPAVNMTEPVLSGHAHRESNSQLALSENDSSSSSSSSSSDSSSESESSSSDSDSEDEPEAALPQPIATTSDLQDGPMDTEPVRNSPALHQTSRDSVCEQPLGPSSGCTESGVHKLLDCTQYEDENEPVHCGEAENRALECTEQWEKQWSGETDASSLVEHDDSQCLGKTADTLMEQDDKHNVMQDSTLNPVSQQREEQAVKQEETQINTQGQRPPTESVDRVEYENDQSSADQMNVTHLPSFIPPAVIPDSESDSDSEGLVIDMGEECLLNTSSVTTDTKVSLFPAKLIVSLPVSRLSRTPKTTHGKVIQGAMGKRLKSATGRDIKQVKFAGYSSEDQISEISSTTNTSVMPEEEADCEMKEDTAKNRKKRKPDWRENRDNRRKKREETMWMPRARDIEEQDDERKIPSHEYHLREARKLKHKGDAERHKTMKAKLYIQSAIRFILCSYAMESSPSHDSRAVRKMYEDTIALIQHVLRMSGDRDSRQDMTRSDPRIIVICLRCQSLLYHQLFKMKREGAMKHQKILQDHFSHKVKPISVTQLSPGAHYDAAAPRSPVPSPASVGSTGSAGSGTEQLTSVHHSTHHSGRSENMSVAVPHNVVLMTQQHLNTMNYILKSHDLWRQSEEIEQKHCKNFFVDVCNKLSPLSSVLSLVDWMHSAVKWLSET